jgi:two-component system cell cycle sensor histidine kinase/response regulator CckA
MERRPAPFISEADSRETAEAGHEFSRAAPVVSGAAAVDLRSLVHHREAVDFATHLEAVQQRFRAAAVDFMAVENGGRVVGICSRGQVGFVMSSRFGFALYSKDPISTVMVAQPLLIALGTPVLEVLERAFHRHGSDFHDDAVLVDGECRLVGMIKIEVLAQLQTRLVSEQINELQRQQETLRRQNLELFQANHAARQSQGLYLGLFASHALGVVLLDDKGGIHEHNARLAELLNLGGVTVAAASLAEWMGENDRPAFLALLEAHAHGAVAPANHEFTFNIPGRGARLIRCSMGWIRETGQICACLDDVTEQRAMERSLVRQEKQTLLDTLVGGIAHELNNKLAPVMGFSELLQMDASERQFEHLALIIRSVDEAAKIIRQLLELSKPAAQHVQVLDLRAVAEETLAILKFNLREAGCAVRTLLPSAPVRVTADAGQLKQVALNLIINALHAMDRRPEPVLTVEVRSFGPVAELVVSDNGCGIEAEVLSRIFDPFFTTKSPEKGTGLGLSVCYSIVRQHGGEIRVESRPGVGSKFTVSLGLVAEVPLFADRKNPANAFIQPAKANGLRVLVVEDEVVLRRLLQELLRSRFGCHVEIATNGVEAMAAIEQSSFALVLADIRMPEMSGTELYLRVREMRPELARRFIFVTGHPGENALAAEIAKWNVPVVSKPFTLSRLAEVCGPFLEMPPARMA